MNEKLCDVGNENEADIDLFTHPLVEAVLEQKTVRCSTFYEDESEKQEQKEKTVPNGQEKKDRNLFGLNDETATDSLKTNITVMGCLKGAYNAYKYVNQVRSSGTYIGVVGSVGLVALKGMFALYRAHNNVGVPAPASISSSIVSNEVSVFSGAATALYWFAFGAAVGVAIHSEGRWWLTDQNVARQHLTEAQRLAHILKTAGHDQMHTYHTPSKENSHGKHYKHRRRRRGLDQQ